MDENGGQYRDVYTRFETRMQVRLQFIMSACMSIAVSSGQRSIWLYTRVNASLPPDPALEAGQWHIFIALSP